jgi:hypothetical protein
VAQFGQEGEVGRHINRQKDVEERLGDQQPDDVEAASGSFALDIGIRQGETMARFMPNDPLPACPEIEQTSIWNIRYTCGGSLEVYFEPVFLASLISQVVLRRPWPQNNQMTCKNEKEGTPDATGKTP